LRPLIALALSVLFVAPMAIGATSAQADEPAIFVGTRAMLAAMLERLTASE
jgi:hypothetical protein